MNYPSRLTRTNKPAETAVETPTRLRFVDFSLRAWREGPYLQVIAHSTPAGGMRHPVALKLGDFSQDDYRLPVDAPLAQGHAWLNLGDAEYVRYGNTGQVHRPPRAVPRIHPNIHDTPWCGSG